MKALLSQPTAPQPTLREVQQMLVRYGYQLPISGELDEATRTVLTAFQLHFRPSLCDGLPDAESIASLQVLLESGD